LQRGHLALKRGVGEVELILRGKITGGNSLLARKFIFQITEPGGVVGARNAILRGLLQRIERAGKRALRVAGDRSLVGWAEAGIVQDALVLREQRIANLLLRAEKLIVQRVGVGQLLVGKL